MPTLAEQAAAAAKKDANEIRFTADTESKSGTVAVSKTQGRLTLGVYVKAMLTGKKVSAGAGLEGVFKF